MSAQYEESNTTPYQSYQVLVTNMSWRQDAIRMFRSSYDSKRTLPVQMAFDIPENVLDGATKSTFNDVIESYVYNALTRKFGHELQSAQIWLPID